MSGSTSPENNGAEKRAARARGLRRNLYEHVDISLRTLDIVIVLCAAFIIGAVILGILSAR
ncbi:MAG: hypothetical protein LBR87_07495 [Synergistaceae bacterium]|jgi:hypothetical protein|nr:hypothetical protein [Synergistaceae bacterium]